MKLFYVVVCCLFATHAHLHAHEDYAIDHIPQELKNRAAVTVRNEDISIEMRANNQVIQRVKKAITVYNKNGNNYAYIPLYYDKSAVIKSVKGIIYDEFGRSIRKISVKDFTDVSAADGFSLFSDTRLKYFQYEPLLYPYTIEFEYEIQHKQNLVIPQWNPNFRAPVSVEKSRYTFTAPKDTKIRIHALNIADEPQIEQSEKTISWTWQTSLLPAVKEENFTKGFEEQSVRLYIVPENISYYGRNGTITDWENFGKWVYDNLLQGKQNLPETVKNHVLELTKDAKTPKEKAKILYDYLQQKTRYVSIQIGIGGFEPFPASDVEKYSYGDCKALVNYMQNLLAFVDIPSYYCIVEAGNQKRDLRVNFANVQDGNHIILCIPFENDTTWLECTSQSIPFGFLSDFTDDRLVLACTPSGGKILKTPTYTETDNRQIRVAKLKLIDEDELKGTITTNFYGTQYDNHIDVIRANNTDKMKLLTEHYDINSIQFNHYNYREVKEQMPYVIEELEVTIPRLASKLNKRLVIPSVIFNSFYNIPKNDERTQPVYINRGFTDVDITEIELPENINKKMLPIEKSFNCKMGTYIFSAKIIENKLITSRKLILKQGVYDANSYADFYEFVKSVNSTDRGRFTLEVKSEI